MFIRVFFFFFFSQDFKKQRNKVKSLVRSAKKSYFDKLIELNKSASTIWKAINEINKSHPPPQKKKKKKKKKKKRKKKKRKKKKKKEKKRKKRRSTTIISSNMFNPHFLTLAETLAQSSGLTSDNVACSKSLREFCNKKLNPNESFIIPPMTVFDVC